MRYATVLILLGAWATPAFAIEQIVVTAQACRKIVEHVPSKDVEYKPGVDVHGKKVAPADLSNSYAKLVPDEITLNVGADLADRLGRKRARDSGLDPKSGARPTLAYEGKVPLGKVTLKGNRVFWNDEPLLGDDEALLAASCRNVLGQTEVAK